MSEASDIGIGRVLLLSHTHPFGPFRVGSHHYARELARRGVRVVHLSTPISLAHVATGRVRPSAIAAVPRGPHGDADGVTYLVPRSALPRPHGPFRVLRELARHALPTEYDVVLVDQPLLWDSSVPRLADTVVYRPTDTYPGGVKAALQRRILDAADATVATSDEVLRQLGDIGIPSLVLENGVELERFRSDIAPATAPVCVYVGALDDRFDWAQLTAWATSHPDARFLIAGPTPTRPPVMPANVELLGPVEYRDVPALLRRARVGILPLSDDPSNAGRSPMKRYEYLAAGLRVVARETPGIRADDDAGVFTYRDATDADAALDRALSHPTGDAGLRLAASQSWEAKSDELLSFLARVRG